MKMFEIVTTQDKCSKAKALGYMIKKVKLLQGQMKAQNIQFDPNIDNVPLNKDLEKVFEFLQYSIELIPDLVTLRDKIETNVSSYEVDLVEFYSYKYTLAVILRSLNFSTSWCTNSAFTSNLILIIVFLEMIELIKFRTDKHKVIGVDIKENKVKYTSGARQFDVLMSTYRDIADINLINKEGDRLFRKFTATPGALPVGAEILGKDPRMETLVCVLDAFDDTFRYRDCATILIDIINQKTGLDFAPINMTNIDEWVINHKSVVYRTGILQTRKRLTPSNGVLLRNERYAILLKDVALTEDFPFVVATYTTNGREDSLILPLTVSGVLNLSNLEPFNMILDYYGLEVSSEGTTPIGEYENINPSLWKERKTNFRDVAKDAYYYQRRVEPYLRKTNGEPSEKAKALAKKYNIQIPNGKTLVDEQIREYHKDLKDVVSAD